MGHEKKIKVAFLTSPAVRERVRKQAAKERRSMNAWLDLAVQNVLVKREAGL